MLSETDMRLLLMVERLRGKARGADLGILVYRCKSHDERYRGYRQGLGMRTNAHCSRLVERGLLQLCFKDGVKGYYALTPAGRDALKRKESGWI